MPGLGLGLLLGLGLGLLLGLGLGLLLRLGLGLAHQMDSGDAEQIEACGVGCQASREHLPDERLKSCEYRPAWDPACAPRALPGTLPARLGFDPCVAYVARAGGRLEAGGVR